LGQLLAEGVLDSCAEGAEVLGQVAQERDRGAVVAQQGRPFGELRLTISSGLPAIPGAIDFANGQLETSEQMLARSTHPSRVRGTRAPVFTRR
jgi:hypothetical protein